MTQCTADSLRGTRLDKFEDIRPFRDHEVPEVLARLQRSGDIVNALVKFQFPRLGGVISPIARMFARSRLKLHFDGIDSIGAFQDRLSQYFGHMVKTTTDGFGYAGLEGVASGDPIIFVSNHRDITLDSGFLNYALYLEGRSTIRTAIGDNLFSHDSAADLMRLNKGFVVKRKAMGRKAMYQAMQTTSVFIRESIEEGEQVWIAQGAGRAKDGFDRTEPAIIKMLALAWGKSGFKGFMENTQLVPVSISYELDPCDLAKARELYVVEESAQAYVKEPDEDLRSMIAGLTGAKGRVRLVVGRPIDANIDSAEQASLELDRQIVTNLQAFPTHEWAWGAQHLLAEGGSVQSSEPHDPRSARLADLRERYSQTPSQYQPYLLRQYANLIANKRELLTSSRNK